MSQRVDLTSVPLAGIFAHMFDQSDLPPGTAGLARLIATLGQLDQGVDDCIRIDRIRLLEELKSAAAAAQARETAVFAASQRAEQLAQGVPAERAGRGIAGQLGLARRTSPHQASRYLGWSRILTDELPNTFAALQAGRVNEWRAMIVARETIWLSREHRLEVDAELAPHLESLGDRRVEAEAKKLAYRLDPQGFVDRIRGAENDRHVGLRPAPEAMARLSGLLPVAQGVAAHTALTRHADTLISQGDPRSRGQIMADTLVERLTGQAHATDVPVEINLIMTDLTLFQPDHPDRPDSADSFSAGGAEPAHLDGYGPIPAGLARWLIRGASDSTPMWIRRLYTAPGTGQLAAMDSRRRFFAPNQQHFVRVRDQYCRTSWCEAPIRHTDHITPAEHGGPTSVDHAQGYCASCNYTKQAPGWITNPLTGADGRHVVEITTPTGHRYLSRGVDPPGSPPPGEHYPPVELRLADWRHAA